MKRFRHGKNRHEEATIRRWNRRRKAGDRRFERARPKLSGLVPRTYHIGRKINANGIGGRTRRGRPGAEHTEREEDSNQSRNLLDATQASEGDHHR